MPKILAIGDLHGYLPEVPECDILLISGDVCPIWNHHTDIQRMWLQTDFNDWLGRIPAKRVVGIAGNHDFIMEKIPGFGHSLKNWTYLQDQSVEIDGVVIHGAPWTPKFGRWAFMQEDHLLEYKWDRINKDADILLVHGPPYGATDRVLGKGNYDHKLGTYDKNVGSKTLVEAIGRHGKLSTVVCGHIHEAWGTAKIGRKVIYNVSYLNDMYEPTHDPMVVA